MGNNEESGNLRKDTSAGKAEHSNLSFLPTGRPIYINPVPHPFICYINSRVQPTQIIFNLNIPLVRLFLKATTFCLDATKWLRGIYCTRYSSFIITILLRTFLIPHRNSQGSRRGSRRSKACGLSKLIFAYFRIHVLNLVLPGNYPLCTTTDPFGRPNKLPLAHFHCLRKRKPSS